MTTTNRPLRFTSDRVFITPGIHDLMMQGAAIRRCLQRHFSNDWGDVCDDDRGLNDQSLQDGSRLLSVYRLGDGTKIWIITDAADEHGERYATTVLLPSEY